MKIGYKGMNSDMSCRGIKFEVGKAYYVDKDKVVKVRSNPIDYNRESSRLKICSDDVIHYCSSLKNVFSFYPNKAGYRFFKVQILGEYVVGENKEGTDAIKILEEVSKEEIAKCNEEVRRDILDKLFRLDLIRDLQEKFPVISIGGSLSLYLRGYFLERFENNEGDYDLVSPYWIDLKEINGVRESEDEKNSGNDFDDTFTHNGKKIDLCISPESRYEIITYRGHQYKVNPVIDVIEAKARYAKAKGGRKHLNDLLELLEGGRKEWQ